MLSFDHYTALRVGVVVSAIITCSVLYRLSAKGRSHDPPGPPRWPIIGNLFNFPTSEWARVFAEWHRVYGNFVYAKLLRTPIYIICDPRAVEDILNDHGKLSAGRPPNVMVQELMGWEEWGISGMQPGKYHQEGRLRLRKATNKDALDSYKPLIDEYNLLLLQTAANFSGDPSPLINRSVGKLVVRITYADAITTQEEDILIAQNEESVRLSLEASLRVHLVDYFPLLKYVPAWVPGAGFQKLGAHVKNLNTEIRNRPWQKVLSDTNQGIQRLSLANRIVEAYGANATSRDTIAITYAGAQSTTSSSMLIALYGLLMYPEAQACAAQEIERVIGHDRIPKVADLSRLPYISAVWKEALRWSPPAPIGVPHVLTSDHVYGGYVMPKGSMIFPNVKKILNDERIWENPTTFNPDRFLQELQPGQCDPRTLIYGFGRRICPGRDMADQTAMNMLMVLLWAFEIVPIEGEGLPDRVHPKFVDSLIAPPAPFRCQFRFRSDRIAQTIREACSGL